MPEDGHQIDPPASAPVVRYVTIRTPNVPERRALVDAQISALVDRPHLVQTDWDLIGPWGNVRRGLLDTWARASRSTHVCVIQDDAALCPEFPYHLERAVAARPDHLVQPFTAALFIRDALDRGDAWATSDDLVHGLCWAMPVAWIPDLLEFSERFRDDYRDDDVRVAHWCWETGRTLWHTATCLVEHARPRDSLVGHGGTRYRTASVLRDPAALDFDVIPDDPVHKSGRSRSRGVEEYLDG